MEIQKIMGNFHEILHYEKSTEINFSALKAHQCSIIKNFDSKRVAIKVRNFHFEALEVFLYIPDGATSIKRKIDWQKAANCSGLYGLKEGIEQALRILYYLNIPLGECVLQRMDGKKFSVYSVQERLLYNVTSYEKNTIIAFINRYQESKQLTYGADIEGLVYHKERNKWIAASALLAEDHNIGWDAAAVMQKQKVVHPILELRPQPGISASQLFTHLLQLYKPFSILLKENGMKLIGGANPYKYFFLGSHLHIGNKPPTFKHAALLDAYIGLPMAVIDYNDPTSRRVAFGQLGAVRQNDFNGFEYRTLSSIGEHILESKPLFEMFAYINENAAALPLLKPSLSIIFAYYQHQRKELFYYLRTCRKFMKDNIQRKDYDSFVRPFYDWIELLYRRKSMNDKNNL
ncbi:putative amidoligase domain-containing protein [Bacillus taeanensis]|uniref:Uncharacterized protein n=1 Tax=Bacillus taeanensis TaxID=273032 RepID=A0A366Y0J5_9BACI|nr:hypothetical protein [Bacillus taeanensis]RBW69924.1 hypothetical protein DS031_08680 [Bacillus taeanensis]